MKKSLLLSALVLASSVSASAQLVNKEQVKNPLPKLMLKNEMKKEGEKSMKKAASNGVYYSLTGGLWYGWGADGFGAGYSIYDVAPYVDYTVSPHASAGYKWSINGQELSDQGDLLLNYSGGSWYYAPTLSSKSGMKTVTFNIGDNNIFGAQKNTEYQVYKNGIIGTDSIWPKYPCDDHAWTEYQGQKYSNVSVWGLLDSDNLYGSGNYVEEGTLYPSFAAEQPYAALNSPLYVEDIILKGVTFTQPIPAGKKLAIDICNSVSYTQKDGSIAYTAGDEVWETIYAEAEDVTISDKPETRNNKTIYEAVVRFSKKTVDAFGNETVEPFVIPAGKDFVILVYGFQDEGIDFGLEGLDVPAEDDNARPAKLWITDGTNAYNLSYSSEIVLNMGLTSIFDNVDVPTNDFLKDEPEGFAINVLKVSDDGKTVTTYGQAEDSSWNLGAALVGTATPWFDEEENENYTLDLPEWVTEAGIDTSYWNGTNLPSYNFFFCQCEPLPAGVKGRKAVIYVEGRGIKSQNPIILIQGDETAAINNVAADNNTTRRNVKFFNAAGQTVSKSTKGLILNGNKKFINK